MPERIPEISEELINWLDELFPNKCPRLSDGERKIWFDAGCAFVVQFLKSKREEILEQNLLLRQE